MCAANLVTFGEQRPKALVFQILAVHVVFGIVPTASLPWPRCACGPNRGQLKIINPLATAIFDF